MMYLKTLNKIVIWKKPDNTYYYKVIKGHYIDYDIGYTNQYGHVIVLVIYNLEYRVRKIPKKENKELKTEIKPAIINTSPFKKIGEEATSSPF